MLKQNERKTQNRSNFFSSQQTLNPIHEEKEREPVKPMADNLFLTVQHQEKSNSHLKPPERSIQREIKESPKKVPSKQEIEEEPLRKSLLQDYQLVSRNDEKEMFSRHYSKEKLSKLKEYKANRGAKEKSYNQISKYRENLESWTHKLHEQMHLKINNRIVHKVQPQKIPDDTLSSIKGEGKVLVKDTNWLAQLLE